MSMEINEMQEMNERAKKALEYHNFIDFHTHPFLLFYLILFFSNSFPTLFIAIACVILPIKYQIKTAFCQMASA